MQVKRLQYFENILTGQLVKVTKVIRQPVTTRKKDLCLIKDVVNHKLVETSARYLLSDSLRRKYQAV